MFISNNIVNRKFKYINRGYFMIKIFKSICSIVLLSIVTFSNSVAREGDQISIVGSSTVFPLSLIHI